MPRLLFWPRRCTWPLVPVQDSFLMIQALSLANNLSLQAFQDPGKLKQFFYTVHKSRLIFPEITQVSLLGCLTHVKGNVFELTTLAHANFWWNFWPTARTCHGQAWRVQVRWLICQRWQPGVARACKGNSLHGMLIYTVSILSICVHLSCKSCNV